MFSLIELMLLIRAQLFHYLSRNDFKEDRQYILINMFHRISTLLLDCPDYMIDHYIFSETISHSCHHDYK